MNKRYGKFVVFDRTPFDAYIYMLYVAGKSEGLEEMREIAAQSLEKLDIIFMFPIEGNEHITLKDDGLRDINVTYRETINSLFLRELALVAAMTDKLPPIYNITGSRHDRIAFAAEKLGLSSSVAFPQGK